MRCVLVGQGVPVSQQGTRVLPALACADGVVFLTIFMFCPSGGCGCLLLCSSGVEGTCAATVLRDGTVRFSKLVEKAPHTVENSVEAIRLVPQEHRHVHFVNFQDCF